jgi:hypothetical protein
MITKRKAAGFAAMFILPMLGVTGCGSSGGGGGGGDDPTSQPPPPEVVEAMVEQVMLPAVQIVGILDPFAAIAGPAAAAAGLQEDGCDGAACPRGGSFEVCQEGASFGATYSNCDTDGLLTIDGTVDLSRLVVSGTEHSCLGTWDVSIIDPELGRFNLEGTADTSWSGNMMSSDFDVSVNNNSMGHFTVAGRITSSQVGDCLRQESENVLFNTVGVARTTVAGVLTYCPDAAWPTGVRSLGIVDSRGDLLYELDFNASGTGTAHVQVSDISDGTELMECQVDLDMFDAVCTAMV